MRTAIRRSLASLLGTVTLGVAGLAGAAPAQAAVSDCPSGYFCAWTQENAQGTMFKTRTDMADTGSYGTEFGSYINRTSVYACMYESADHYPWNGYSVEWPSNNGSWTSGGSTTIASLKFVRTERECAQNAYPNWQAETSPKAAGFGDLDGNRKADLLVRDKAGRLWFTPGDGSGRLVGTGGWNAMSALTRHGDFSRDGREDVIAREASTGKLWLYPGTGTGGLSTRKLVGNGGWNGMNHITAVGDLSRDGRADLLAVEKSTGKLWLYPGTSTGTLGSRKLVGTGGWNAMNALAGSGDFNSDGRVDLIAREASTGKLWLYPGTSTGTLGSRKLIGTGGWNAMESLITVGDFSGDGRPDLAAVTNRTYAIDGFVGNPGWLVTYNGLGTGGLASGVRRDGEWFGLNGFF
ncbi:ATP/GTP-binding protein [Streptomyces sp. R302]|uniref:FG-GAP-like repeat-containing protein n=1 Tax=unclassified Streptomyces TaxID=2593676 RepID=UPI00145EBF3A|nr:MULTISPECIES: FG-GAP-like repeat-containing protein [unclassified Streptomyces]NML50165.1 ATP/GTP-binding protein [Streptomyces sp. R301]NML79156.1 ATP/GTP-binding protein [Streptomyces sp. R302]